MKTFVRLALGLTVALALSITAFGGPINGSDGFSLVGVNQNGVNLSVSTLFDDTFQITSIGLGNYSIIPLSTNYTDGPGLNLANLGAFVLTNATYGTFTAQSSGSFIVSQSVNFLDIYLLGTYSGLPGLCGGSACTPTLTSYRITFDQSGESISAAATLSSPPTGSPEPSTMALIGSGLMGLAFVRRRRKA
jgi:hypothetical protein